MRWSVQLLRLCALRANLNYNVPKRAKSICRHHSCGMLIDKPGMCAQHMRQINIERGSSAERGYGHKWRKARQVFLAQNPLCACHLERGDVVSASVVDHVIPHKGNMSLFWDSKNWQALCKRCHDTKTATEDGGFGRGG